MARKRYLNEKRRHSCTWVTDSLSISHVFVVFLSRLKWKAVMASQCLLLRSFWTRKLEDSAIITLHMTTSMCTSTLHLLYSRVLHIRKSTADSSSQTSHQHSVSNFICFQNYFGILFFPTLIFIRENDI